MSIDPSRALLFQPWSFGTLELRNRVVMAPMTRRQTAIDGVPTDAMTAYYARRADNEVGLIISEGIHIDATHAPDTFTVPRLETLDQLSAWKEIVRAIHDAGGAFAPQLWHTGRLAADPIGPSAAELPPRADGTPRPLVRAMEEEDFDQVLTAYRRSAVAAVEIGSDALEIHGAHGYLLDSFLSPTVNQRTDRYGGSMENRMRFPLEVVREVRKSVGPDFPILYRFSQWKVDDYREMKFHTPEDLLIWVRALRGAGVDLQHVSTRDARDPAFPDVSLRSFAGWTRELSEGPVIAVGKVSVTLGMDESYGTEPSRIVDPSPWIQLVEDGEADLLAIGRALIANADWVPLVRAGRWTELQLYHKDLLRDLT